MKKKPKHRGKTKSRTVDRGSFESSATLDNAEVIDVHLAAALEDGNAGTVLREAVAALKKQIKCN